MKWIIGICFLCLQIASFAADSQSGLVHTKTALAAPTPHPDATTLMNWAERAYPQFFNSQEQNQFSDPYLYRYYPSSKNYLGIAGTGVWILGPVTGSSTLPAYVGEVNGFNCLYNPGICLNWPRVNVSTSGQAVPVGSKLTLTAITSGPGPFDIQWYRKGVMIAGQRNATLTVDKVDASDAGPYHVQVANSYGTVYSDWVPVTIIGRSDVTARSGRVNVYWRYGGGVEFPSASQSWDLVYKFRVPPLPVGGWTAYSDTFYVWGDLQLDDYGSEGRYSISPYKYIQLVPQLLIGNALSDNDANFLPKWNWLPTWAIQASYFWQKGQVPYSQTGRLVNVKSGEQVTTKMTYNAASGTMFVSISTPSGESSMTVDRPFPNEPNLFANWRTFFEAAQAKSGKLIAGPVLTVEPYTDKLTVCSILPFEVDWISVPGIASSATQFTQEIPGGLPCDKPMVKLNF